MLNRNTAFEPAEHNLPDDLWERGLEAIEDIVEAADHDDKTGEVILWGRWGLDGKLIEERFDQLEDIVYFLENFGWSIEAKGPSRYSNRHIHFKPFGKRQVLSRADVLSVLAKHELRPQTHAGADHDRLYSVREAVEPARIENVKAELVSANVELLEFLKRHPNLIHTISPRQLEEVVGDIFTNLGYEVELTPQTRDGGYDIRALRKDGVGTLLYLVECKRYSPQRPVGVDLVRALYGTVSETRASHGVMATTSHFSPDAKEYAERVKYQLSLRDYGDLTKWIHDLPVRAR